MGTFGRKNGGPDFATLRRQVGKLRGGAQGASHSEGDYRIGCIMPSEPVWFRREHWVAPPADWPASAVKGKAYDLSAGEGARVWEA